MNFNPYNEIREEDEDNSNNENNNRKVNKFWKIESNLL